MSTQLNNPQGAQKPSWPNQSSGEEHIQGKSGRQTLPRCQSLKDISTYWSHDGTFTGQTEGFPPGPKGLKRWWKVLYEIIPRFGLSSCCKVTMEHHLLLKVTQGVSKALGITYCLYCAWRPKSSGRVERTKQLKINDKKDNLDDLLQMEGGFANSHSPLHLHCS